MKHDAVTRTIGERVRAARADAGMTRKQLSEKADVSERYLNELENGDANVSVGILGRVAQALSV
jgi:XRE family aerobic/anaerobic benzoate catabolism transcriptional regulator